MQDKVVVIYIDGLVEVKTLANPLEVFESAKEIIGCNWLEAVNVQKITDKIQLVMLCNEDAYAEYTKDPGKVNKIATYIYNGGKAGHFILGDVVLALSVETDEGEEFVAMLEVGAEKIQQKTFCEFLPKAE